MNNEEKILNLLTQMQSQINGIQDQINELDIKVDSNHVEVIKHFDKLENKLDDIETQNADNHLTIGGEIRKVKASLSKIEIVTADNWGDIARIKANRRNKAR